MRPLLPLRRDARHNAAVLGALAVVGDAGMTDIALAVTLAIPEPRLHAALKRLTDAGLVEPDSDDGGLTQMQRACYRLVPRAPA